MLLLYWRSQFQECKLRKKPWPRQEVGSGVDVNHESQLCLRVLSFQKPNETLVLRAFLSGMRKIFLYQFLFPICERVPDVLITLHFGLWVLSIQRIFQCLKLQQYNGTRWASWGEKEVVLVTQKVTLVGIHSVFPNPMREQKQAARVWDGWGQDYLVWNVK